MKWFVDSNGQLHIGRAIATAITAIIIIVLLMSSFGIVPTGYRGVLTRFGKIISIEPEGLAIYPPWNNLTVFNVRAETSNVDKAEGSTADQQPVHVSLTVRYAVLPDKVAEVFEQYSRNGDLSSYVETATMETFKAVTARYTAPDLIAKRTQVSADISELLRTKLALYGAKVINIDMKNFAFSGDYMNAINAKVTEEQKKLAAENKVKTVEAEQRAKVVTAEAERDAAKAKADGEAYAVREAAKAQAEALRVQNAALNQNKDVLELRKIEVEMVKAQRWDGALPQQLFGSAPVPFMSVPAK